MAYRKYPKGRKMKYSKKGKKKGKGKRLSTYRMSRGGIRL